MLKELLEMIEMNNTRNVDLLDIVKDMPHRAQEIVSKLWGQERLTYRNRPIISYWYNKIDSDVVTALENNGVTERITTSVEGFPFGAHYYAFSECYLGYLTDSDEFIIGFEAEVDNIVFERDFIENYGDEADRDDDEDYEDEDEDADEDDYRRSVRMEDIMPGPIGFYVYVKFNDDGTLTFTPEIEWDHNDGIALDFYEDGGAHDVIKQKHHDLIDLRLS